MERVLLSARASCQTYIHQTTKQQRGLHTFLSVCKFTQIYNNGNLSCCAKHWSWRPVYTCLVHSICTHSVHFQAWYHIHYMKYFIALHLYHYVCCTLCCHTMSTSRHALSASSIAFVVSFPPLSLIKNASSVSSCHVNHSHANNIANC